MWMKVANLLKKSPDELIKKFFGPFWMNNEKTCKRILLVSMLTCLFNYFYLIVNGYGGPDAICEGVWYYIGGENAVRQARWFLPMISSFFGKNIVIPLVIVVFYCLAIAVSAFIVFKLLEIKNTGFQILTVSAMVSFPVITRQFAYLYTALAYAVSFLMVVLAAWLLRKRRIVCFLLGIGCLLLMLGSYQAYIGAAAAIAVICFLFDMVKKRSVIESMKDFGIYVLSGILAGGLDLVVARAMMVHKGIEDFDRVASVSLSETLKYLGFSLKASYSWFFMYFESDVLARNKLYLVLLLVLLLLVVANVVILIREKKIGQSILLVVSFALLPLAMNICAVIFPHEGIYDVMRYQYILVIPLMFALIGVLPQTIWGAMTQWIVYADVFLLIIGYTISSNATAICYKLAYESTYNQAVCILSEVYELDGYELHSTPIVLGGHAIEYQDTYDAFRHLFRYSEIESGPIFWGDEYGLTVCRYYYFLNYLGVNPQWLTDEQYYYVIGTQEYKSMPSWPAEGSVQMIDGYAVVKMGD